MPLYDYRCESCGETTEILQRFDDPPLTICPRCGGPLRKLLSAPAFQFKGSGWYVTDYARKSGGGTAAKGEGASGAASAGSKEGGGSESKGESKSESKGESKGDSKPAAGSGTGGAAKPSSD